jgi:hypothetical protein
MVTYAYVCGLMLQRVCLRIHKHASPYTSSERTLVAAVTLLLLLPLLLLLYYERTLVAAVTLILLLVLVSEEVHYNAASLHVGFGCLELLVYDA